MIEGGRVTILGKTGFIGKHLHQLLHSMECDLFVPARDELGIFEEELGTVFYCIGLTADFRTRPFDTVNAHVSLLARILEHAHFSRLIYLSSTRVYAGARDTNENASLLVNPSSSSDFYNLSKLMGESLCLQSSRDTRIARLSNVYGEWMPEQNFLSAVLHEARCERHVKFRSQAKSNKDFVYIEDALKGLLAIAHSPELNGITNVASGFNISNSDIAAVLTQEDIVCEYDLNSPLIEFPRIDVSKLERVCGVFESSLLQKLPDLLNLNGGLV